jgi:hypothetical protein
MGTYRKLPSRRTNEIFTNFFGVTDDFEGFSTAEKKLADNFSVFRADLAGAQSCVEDFSEVPTVSWQKVVFFGEYF